MQIGIITHHDVHNHGAQLQLNALVKVLESFGHKASALSYTKNLDFLDDYARHKYNITLRSLPYYTGYLMRRGIKRTLFNIKKRAILDEFRVANKLVNGYYSKEKDLDCVFIGSDEVFSIEPGLNPVFWGMGVPNKNVFSYAGCFGPTTLEFIGEKHAEEFIRAGIDRFKELSVRDQNSHDIILSLSGKDVPIVCDPVILYGYEQEVSTGKKPIDGRYLVVYAYDNNMNEKREVERITEYARNHNLTIVSVGFYHSWCDQNVNVTPTDLIHYIKHAECVVTDTFHGTVVSIIMNTSFVTKIRGNQNKLGYLLEEYELSDRSTEGFEDLERKFAESIDFSRVNWLVEGKRNASRAFIGKCLGRASSE